MDGRHRRRRSSPAATGSSPDLRATRDRTARPAINVCLPAWLGVLLADEGRVGMGMDKRPRGRVLVVDDDPLMCDLITSTLTEHGYPTRRASDAREGLYLVQR